MGLEDRSHAIRVAILAEGPASRDGNIQKNWGNARREEG